MDDVQGLKRENDALRERLSRLSQASLRINASLELEAVLQGTLDAARSLTGASYGVITLLDNAGQVQDFLSSGMTGEEAKRIWVTPDGMRIFEYLGSLTEPLRTPDLLELLRQLGLPEFRPPASVGDTLSFLAAPALHRGERVANIFVGDREGGREFSPEDEETLVMFASQAALVIANARRYREEQRARNDLETLINTSPVGVVVFDAVTGMAPSFNREARRIVDALRDPAQSPEELLQVITVRRADGREVWLGELALADALGNAETVWAEEIVLAVPDGRSVAALVNATPIHGDDGELMSFVVTLQDLAPLRELGRSRAEFLAMVSRELLGPLTSIKGSIDTLLNLEPNLDPAETRQFFGIIRDQSEHMRDLVGDLLDVARIATGDLALAPEPVELGVLVEEARRRFGAGGTVDNITVVVPTDLPRIMADRRRMVQVLGNLLGGAGRFSREPTVIRVSAENQDPHVAVSVSVSMSEENRRTSGAGLPDLFGVLASADGRERGWSPNGTGLGLTVCQGIVEAHGGRVQVDDQGPNLGWRYVFTIPTEDAASSSTTPKADASSRRGRNETAILVVDDDPQALRYIRDTLAGAGYHPLVASDSEQALRLLASEQPGLAMLDLGLSGANAIELMDAVRTTADVPVMLLSEYGRDGDIAHALEMGASDYLVKPFSPTELTARVGAALRRGVDSRRPDPTGRYQLGNLSIDYDLREVRLAGTPVDLTAMEFDLLRELAVHEGRAVSYDWILRQVWRRVNPKQRSLVRSMVKNIRRKLQDDVVSPSFIVTVPRVGYRMGAHDPTSNDDE